MGEIKIDKTSTVDKQSILSGDVCIGKNCKIVNSKINNSTICDNVEILDSYIDGAQIKNGCTVGPFARIRPTTILNEKVKVGNFVEIKNSTIGKRTKVPHLSYVGDACVGEDVNIGCGVIFCNYDGKNKTQSFVGNKVFIGSNVNIVSPVVIENESFIAAGTTVTDNIKKGEFCIGRVKNQIKYGIQNMYLTNFKNKPKYFGTDGIRQIYDPKTMNDLCFKVGYALTKLTKNAKVLVGRDTRPSGKIMLKHLANGVFSGGGKVYDAGIISTAGTNFLSKVFSFDFAVVLTASHNPSEYNGIKIFSKNGQKLNENQELLLEKYMFAPKNQKIANIQKLDKEAYFEHLLSVCNEDLKNIKVFLDLSNGATSGYAKYIFEKLGATVCEINSCGEINKDASVLCEDLFKQNMQKSNCDIGFCFDGDADRVMCITKDLQILDGDKILYLLCKYRHEKYAVGTIMTNMAIEKQLKKIGTKLFRTDVGDKYIARLLKSKKIKVGAEESGHVIISEYTQTGDGLLTALYLMNIFVKEKQLFDLVSKIKIYPTVSLQVQTENKNIIKNQNVQIKIKQCEKQLLGFGRVIVRPSGTEPKIRITVEAKNFELAKKVANEIKMEIENELK